MVSALGQHPTQRQQACKYGSITTAACKSILKISDLPFSFVGLKFFDHWESFKASEYLEGLEDWSLISYYLEVYGLIAVANCLITLARAFLFAYGGLCAARSVYPFRTW